MAQQQNKRSENQTDTSSHNNTTMPNDSKDKIYLQLHEQYAINNNANLSTIMTLVVALIAVIGYFGYVFISTTNEYFFKDNGYELYDPYKCQFSLIALMLIYIASLFILAILSCLCVYQGIAQRKEQFIIHAIRKISKIDDKILPEGYNPYLKKGFEVVQGLYGELLIVFRWVSIALTIAVLVRVLISFICEWIKNGWKWDLLLPLSVTIILTGLIVGGIWFLWRRYYHKQYDSYVLRQKEYIEKKMQLKKELRCTTYEKYEKNYNDLEKEIKKANIL